MGKLLIILFFSLSPLIGIPQDTKLINFQEPVQFRFYYAHEHLRDVEDSTSRLRENMVLFTGEKSSLFTSYERLIEMKDVLNKTDQDMAVNPNAPVVLSNRRKVIPDEFLTFFNQTTYISSEFFARHYYLIEERPAIEWEMMDAEQEILGMNAYKAVGEFLGRTWEVWFVPEIPLPTGPWLLYGLPGLIVKAEDTEGHVRFALTAFESAAVENEVINKVKHGAEDYTLIMIHNFKKRMEINRKDFTGLRKKMDDMGRVEYMTAQSGILMSQGLAGSFDVGFANYHSWYDIVKNPIAREPRDPH